MWRRPVVVSIVLAAMAGTPASAQNHAPAGTPVPAQLNTTVPGPLVPSRGETYGVVNYSVAVVSRWMFQANSGSETQDKPVWGYFGPPATGTNSMYSAPVTLPTGALLATFVATVYDDNPSHYIRVTLYDVRCTGLGPCTETQLMSVETSGASTPGYTSLRDYFPDVTWFNYDQSTSEVGYAEINVYFSGSGDLWAGPVLIWYRRQVAPAPAAATFADVPLDHWAFQFIEALVSSGITAGCGGGDYCPDSPVTRAEMAVYLAAALGLDYHDYTP